MTKKRNKKEEFNIKEYWTICIILIIVISIYGIYTLFSRPTTKKLLLDSSKEIVYTFYEDEKTDKIVPALNIKRISEKVNNDINTFANQYINVEFCKIDYHYQINGNILSLLISVEDYSTEGATDVHFLSFIIDLKRLKVLDNNEILDLFKINSNTIFNTLNNDFKSYYEEEIKQNLISSTQTYETYLYNHEITNFIDQACYDIDKGELNIYLDYKVWSPDEVEPYLSNVGYVFVL